MAVKNNLHPNETDRLQALKSLQVLDTPIEERFERITRLARRAFDVPVCAISCVDQSRIWFKSSQGLDSREMSRGESFCQHTILKSETLLIPDARYDKQYASLPCVCDAPGFVFYAGKPILTPDGQPVGVFCLVDDKPRAFSSDDQQMLQDFAALAERELCAKAPNQIAYELVDQIDESWRQMLIDPLTRLWNHEGIMTIAGESLSSISSEQRGMTMVMIHAPGLSQLIKVHGQDASDEAIRQFATALLHEVRENDVVGRTQNDEFLILMNSASEPAAVYAAVNRLKNFIDSYSATSLDEILFGSSAVAAIRVPIAWDGSLSTLLDELDGAMFEAKKATDKQPLIIEAISTKDQSNDQAA